jgi:uncharacterized protein (TIGR03437 family)
MRIALVPFLFWAASAEAQLSGSAYRVLGQPDFVQKGLNLVQGTELNLYLVTQVGAVPAPAAVALDARNGVTHIYIADVGNSRVLGWFDTASYQIGDPPSMVLGQAGPQFTNGIGNRTPATPEGLAVDPATGNLYVADSLNNRILRFPAPFSNPGNFTPDAVIGQADFTTNGANASAAGLNQPQGLAFDAAGNLWVADAANNRVVRFPSAVLDGRSAPQADLVAGQKDFGTSAANAGGSVSASGLNSPRGVALDPQNNLYVSDFQNARVIRFPGPVTASNPAATLVLGQVNFTTRVITSPPTDHTMAGPTGISVTSDQTVYVAVPGENRALAFPLGSPARTVYGQGTFTSSTPNLSSQPRASANGLWGPVDFKLDASGNVYIVDSGNNRVLMYKGGSRTAGVVWGQNDFTGNGRNKTKPTSIDAAYKMAIDYSQAPFPLYVSDTNNNRILIWKNSVTFRNGDPADLVIGQPDLTTAIPNVDNAAQTPTATSLAGQRGMALDKAGNLWVADFGNNRVVHYARPVDQTGRVSADIVLGQKDLVSNAVPAVSPSTFQGPSSIAIGPAGELFISDTGNNRVLQFAPSPTTGSSAIQVFGQPNLSSGAAPGVVSPQTLAAPTGVAIDASYNLFIADTGANRILVFANVQANHSNGLPASVVYGQGNFAASGIGAGPGGLRAPADVVLDGSGNVIVADSGNSRVMVFPSLIFAAPAGTAAQYALGGANQAGLATPSSLVTPIGLFSDRKSTLYVGDTGNNRVVQFLNISVVNNAAGFGILNSIPVALGSLATLKSTVVPGSQGIAPVPWPNALAGWQVVVNDTLQAPLYYVGPDAATPPNGQVNFQVPGATSSGTNRIAVRAADTGELIAGGTFSVGTVGPALFSQNSAGTGQGSILNQDGVTINGPGKAAPRGSVVSLYGTGQGPVDQPVADGFPPASLTRTITVPASDAAGCQARNAICVIFGTNVFGTVQFSGLAPGFVGLWQINVQIPSNAPTGTAVPVHVVLSSPSNTVTMAIQ